MCVLLYLLVELLSILVEKLIVLVHGDNLIPAIMLYFITDDWGEWTARDVCSELGASVRM